MTRALSTGTSPGRLMLLAGVVGAPFALPIPYFPDRLASAVRGALVQDIAARHGVSLTRDARARLSDPSSGGASSIARRAFELLGGRLLRRFARVGIWSSALRSLEVYALGHLFERYLTEHRGAQSVRLDSQEADRVRSAIDSALLRSLSPRLKVASVGEEAPVEDFRDETTRWIDNLVLMGARIPEYVQRRLDTAFDELIRGGNAV